MPTCYTTSWGTTQLFNPIHIQILVTVQFSLCGNSTLTTAAHNAPDLLVVNYAQEPSLNRPSGGFFVGGVACAVWVLRLATVRKPFNRSRKYQ
jgi:hypothetical protein